MSLFDKPLVQCNEADLLALIPGELEGKTLEYKRDQVGKTEADRKEFLYDASSFANALGGHLIFGMDEKDSAPIKLVGLPGVNVDDEILRLEQMMRDGIRPPIVGIQTVPVGLASGGAALVMRIPKSWNPPHQVTYKHPFCRFIDPIEIALPPNFSTKKEAPKETAPLYKTISAKHQFR